ncbi:PREDICTED: uncharacterized protein LOC107165320 [Diuraphis noxia]|uniref:uncharacterized protein LOC107165320 n=1 Tax=Diuraphis noxia TaxID=143948 RepID=UPI0007635581|nr:PREDICTED: uncharacterized protein LOC107165320 [Diuraphis noxia]
MSQVKECLQRSYECSKVPNAIAKACLQKVEKKNSEIQRLKTCQTLKNRFKYVQPRRRDLCKPTSQPAVCKTPFTEDTVYNHSYYKHDTRGNRPKPIMHKDHLVMAGKFQDKTSQRKSERFDNLVVNSRFPMASLTTSYCSYQPVCAKRQNNFKPNISYKEPGVYMYKDNSDDIVNLMADSNITKNCCPFTCL